MGLFSFLAKPTPLTVAERLRDHVLFLKTSPAEQACIAGLRIDLPKYVEERLLMRIGFMQSTVSFYLNETPCREIRDCREILGQMFVDYMTSRPGVSSENGGSLYARASEEYMLQKPHELAGRLLTNLYGGEHKPLEPMAATQFLRLTHGLMREAMELSRDLTAKLRP